MELHNLLKRQMGRVGMDEESLPTNLNQWQSFLTSISNAYLEAEQERYTIERSIEISSQEFMQLTAKMENAQNIARLGYWSFEPTNDILFLSNNLYSLMNLESTSHITNKEQFLELIHPDDKEHFKNLIETVISQKKRTEHEIRIQSTQGTYNWFHMVCDALKEENQQELSGIAMDINKRKQVEEELNLSNQKLVDTARLAGMADVAISVLHNIGNTLNSANVALSIIQETLKKPHFQKLSAICDLLTANASNIENYLTQDPKGKLVPKYLVVLNEEIGKSINIYGTEIDNLSSSINHIKEIIAKQQDISKVHEIQEKVFLPEVIDDALKISGDSLLKRGIVTIKNYKDCGFILTDKSKLIQILINLIKNAQESIEMNNKCDKKNIDISVQTEKDNLKIMVEDTGIGIATDNLKKIFTFGFTTKKTGHGFGLHSSILAAKEIGGNLDVDSKGEGQGATFTLTLPLPIDHHNNPNEDRSAPSAKS